MHELPLFPLNTVLFPGMPLPLHIFEERYKEMIQHCLEHDEPFGVVLIRDGRESFGPLADPYEVGCIAQIEHIRPLEDGRYDLIAVGRERFRIHQIKHNRSYLVGVVELYPMQTEKPTFLTRLGNHLRPLIQRYLEAISEISGADLEAAQLPTDPLAIGYLGASLLQLPPLQKQSFLAVDDATQLLLAVYDVYKEQVPLLQTMPRQDQGPFSIN
ncbi:MAG: LON peptidase substrate-binding domain-containing protein [Anaerolineae bacterium]|nr:LON peptidase substrate-binding domain-containing protein [Anaerolineae bacterium]